MPSAACDFHGPIWSTHAGAVSLPVTINILSSRFAARLQFVCPWWVTTQESTTGQHSEGAKGTVPAEEREGVEKVLLAEDGTFRVTRNHYGGLMSGSSSSPLAATPGLGDG